MKSKVYTILPLISSLYFTTTCWASSSMPVESVDPSIFAEKIAGGLMSIHETLSVIIVPLATGMLSITAFFFIIGLFLGLKLIRLIGALGFVFCLIGVFLYTTAPVISSIVYSSGQNLMK